MWDVPRPAWPDAMRPPQIPATRPETLAAGAAGLEPLHGGFLLWLVAHNRVGRGDGPRKVLVGAGTRGG